MASCSRCGSEKNIERHHIQWRRDGGSNDDSNMRDYCRACHDYQHTKETLIRSIQDKRPSYAAMYRFRLNVLEMLNTPYLIRKHGYRSYWVLKITHWTPLMIKTEQHKIRARVNRRGRR